MNINLKKEIPLLAIVAIPFIYVAFIWNTLPERIPLHWNINGEIDRWGPKIAIFIAPVLTVLLVYVLFLVIQKIDPKGKIEKMGGSVPNATLCAYAFYECTFCLHYLCDPTGGKQFATRNFCTSRLTIYSTGELF